VVCNNGTFIIKRRPDSSLPEAWHTSLKAAKDLQDSKEVGRIGYYAPDIVINPQTRIPNHNHMNLYLVYHYHRHGHNLWIVRSETPSTEEQVIEACNINHGEWIEITHHIPILLGTT